MKKLALLQLLVFTHTLICSQPITMKPLLKKLLSDIGLYQLEASGDPYLHAGDLWHHSIWVHNKMVKLLNNNSSPYTQKLTLSQREKEVLALAALLHDIGKAGRLELLDNKPFEDPRFNNPKTKQFKYLLVKDINGFVNRVIYYQDRQVHPFIGFEYLCGKRNYHMIDRHNGSYYAFNIPKMLDELGLTQQEQALIAVLAGIHYDFGNLNGGKITPKQFLEKLKSLAVTANLHNGKLTKKLIQLAVIIQVADVGGVTPVEAIPTPLFPSGVSCNATHSPIKWADPFKTLHYSCCSCGSIPATGLQKLLTAFNKENT